ncbi:hypothetical protein MBLNU13_g05222t1 [Cladosporium sp. NU13]
MAPWTVRERMILHVLFGYHKLDFYGPAWWAIYRDITKTSRLERTCREDYKYSHGKERTQMYPRRILKPYSQYDAEERAAYDQAFQDVIDSARRQGIALPGSNEDENEDEEHAMDEDLDNQVEGEEAEDEEDEDEDNDDEDEDTDDEYEESEGEEVENEEDAEMEDAEEDYATAQEDSSGMGDAAGDDAAGKHGAEGDFAEDFTTIQESEAGKYFHMEKQPDEEIRDKNDFNVLAESDLSATRHARAFLSAAIGEREISMRNTNVSATPARNIFALPTHLETAEISNPTAATGASSSNPIVPAIPATGTPASPDDNTSGEPQKDGRERPEEQKLETVGKTKVDDEGLKRGARYLKKQLAGMGGVPDWLNEYDLEDDVEEETRGADDEVTEKAQNNMVNGQTPSAGSVQPLETPKKPGATSKKPPRHQVKSAPAGPRVPLALVTNRFQVVPPVTMRSEKYDFWCRTNLDRLLFEEPYNMFPKSIKVTGEKRAPPEEPLPSDERVTNFFTDMFDGKLTRKFILSTLKKEPTSDTPGIRLKKICKSLLEKAEEMTADPRYRLNKVFESEKSPFRNFCLASAAFGQGLKMLHMSDVDYTGVGNQQLVAFAKSKARHLTINDIDFVSSDDPVFKQGGRVHSLWIRQQECPILGESKKYNSANVCIDVMVCQEAHCLKCSKDKDMGRKVKPVTSLPRVHARHITPANEFVAPLLMVSREYEKDYKDEFIVDVNIGVQSIKLWDGTMQDVVVCDAGNCPGCCEALGGVVDRARETREKADTATVRL